MSAEAESVVDMPQLDDFQQLDDYTCAEIGIGDQRKQASTAPVDLRGRPEKPMTGENSENNSKNYSIPQYSVNPPRNTLDGSAEHIADDEFMINLYQACKTIWTIIWQNHYRGEHNSLTTLCDQLKISLGRFLLFQDFLVPNMIAGLHDQYPDLWSSLLELLCEVGILLNRFYMDITSEEDDGALSELMKLLSCAEYLLEGTDFVISPLGFDKFSDEIPLNLIIDQLDSCSQSLMDLGPTVESAYTALDDAEEVDNATLKTTSTVFRVSEPAKQFVKLIIDQFPDADLALVERLGEASWQRSVRIRQTQIYLSGSVPNMEAVSNLKPGSEFYDSALGSSLMRTIEDVSSVFSSYTEHGSASARVPSAPKEVMRGESFICPICGLALNTIKNRTEWKSHVFEDLQPYICTHENCQDQYATFPTRQLWIEHEFLKDRTTKFYHCLNCRKGFGAIDQLSTHLLSHDFSSAEIEVLLDHARKHPLIQEPSPGSETCRICRKAIVQSPHIFAKHVGQHMESIALKSLPADVEESDDDVLSEAESVSETILGDQIKWREQSSGLHWSETKQSTVVEGECIQVRHQLSPPNMTTYTEGNLWNNNQDEDRSTSIDLIQVLDPNPPQPNNAATTLTKTAFTEQSTDIPRPSMKHKCPHCSTQFTRYHNLKSHLLTHSQEKPYDCQQCTSRFRRLHELKRHIRLHTGERVHVCLHCSRRFARKDALARHQEGPGGCTVRRTSEGDIVSSFAIRVTMTSESNLPARSA